MQYNENKYVTLARFNERNYCLKSYFQSIQKQAKQSLLTYYSKIQSYN